MSHGETAQRAQSQGNQSERDPFPSSARPDGEAIRALVRSTYGDIARTGQLGCCGPTSGACGTPSVSAEALGYAADEVAALPSGTNLGLGCGNPGALAALAEGETVLDLGSGAGIDCLLASKRVGAQGRVIGVDMTPDMIARARVNVARGGPGNVELRLGEIEHLPVETGVVDVILSNCVINLSADKPAVFREAFRVLAPGGRLAISDVVLLRPLPDALAADAIALAGCVAGAATVDELREAMLAAGFEHVRVEPKPESRAFIASWLPGSGAEDFVASATLSATKPRGSRACCGPSCCD